jgi:hypothetical protein
VYLYRNKQPSVDTKSPFRWLSSRGTSGSTSDWPSRPDWKRCGWAALKGRKYGSLGRGCAGRNNQTLIEIVDLKRFCRNITTWFGPPPVVNLVARPPKSSTARELQFWNIIRHDRYRETLSYPSNNEHEWAENEAERIPDPGFYHEC